MKRALSVVLLLFVGASVAYLVVSETRSRSTTTDSAGSVAPLRDGATVELPVPGKRSALAEAGSAAGVVAYYFHGTMRCPTCLKMERYAREAIEEALAAEINAGLLEWRAVDYDEPANEHFLKEYGLTASALVVLSQGQAGATSWRNLDRIWDLVSDEASFKEYVVETVNAMLRGES